MSDDVRLESIKAYKRMIEYFRRQIAKLEGEIFSERCCNPKGRIYLPIVNKKGIKKWNYQNKN